MPVQGDLQISDDGRDLLLVSGAAKVGQNIKARAGIFKGSWRYDRQLGVPYFEEILAFGASKELVRRRFLDLVTQTPGVLSVESLTVGFDNVAQVISVNFSCITDTSEIVRDVLTFKAP